MKQTIYLVCGVPASGKTWVCSQLKGFTYVPHDDYIGKDLISALATAAAGDRPVVSEVPFGERELINALRGKHFVVRPYFIIEPAGVISNRHRPRGGTPSPSTMKRLPGLIKLAEEWKAPYGTSTKIFRLLQLRVAP